jgi:hypothetical protein
VAIPEPVEWFRGLSVVWNDVPLSASAGAASAVRGRAAAASGTRRRVVVRMEIPFGRCAIRSIDRRQAATARIRR